MPRYGYTYPDRMIKTDEGKSLYGIWRRVRKNSCEEFAKYPDFFEWAIRNGYKLGDRLHRFDETVEYSPDNCSFLPSTDRERPLSLDERLRANEWNKAVNVIRAVCGMRLFEIFDEEEIRRVG